jgi:hypothetical protein
MQGSIGYLTMPDAYIRLHQNQDSASEHNIREGWKMKSTTTKWLLAKYPDQVAQAAELFNTVAAKLRGTHQPWLLSDITDYIGEPHRMTLHQDCGFKLPPHWKYKRLLRQISPPALLPLMRWVFTRRKQTSV